MSGLAGTLALPHRAKPRTTKSGHDLIRNQQRSMRASDLCRASQPTGGLRDHSRRALHQGLDNKRRVRASSLLLGRELLLQFAEAFPVALPIIPGVGALGLGAVEWTAIAVRRHHLVGFEEQARVSPVKQVNMTQIGRAHV